jgi:enoyl-[acyl-carrier protein] reductase I
VASDSQVDALGAAIDAEFGGLDFILHGAAFAPKDELNNPFVQTSREGFASRSTSAHPSSPSPGRPSR